VGGLAFNAAKHIWKVYRNGPPRDSEGGDWLQQVDLANLDDSPSPAAEADHADIEYKLFLHSILRDAGSITRQIVIERYYLDSG
jgi:hypothetical protein